MKISRTRPTNRVGALSVVVAALGLLLGMSFVAPAGAQDGGDSYTTNGGVSGDNDGNGIPDDLEDALLNSDLGSCSIASYTVGVPFSFKVPSPVDPSQSFLVNQYSQSVRLFEGTAPSGSVELTSNLSGKHSFLFYGVDTAGKAAISGCTSTGVMVGGEMQPNTPGNTNVDAGGTPGAPQGISGSPSAGGVPSGGSGIPGGSGTPGGVGTSAGGAGGPLATTGFGAALPSLLATALVVGGGLLMITVARRRRQN